MGTAAEQKVVDDGGALVEPEILMHDAQTKAAGIPRSHRERHSLAAQL